MEKAIITTVGKDSIGIIAKECTYLAEKNINILDISQSIIGGFFNMMVIADISNATADFNTIQDDLKLIGKNLCVDIKIQHSAIFESMQRI